LIQIALLRSNRLTIVQVAFCRFTEQCLPGRTRAGVFHTKFREAILGELSGAIAKNYIADITRFHRIQASPGFNTAVTYVKQLLDQLPNIRASVERFPADGTTRIGEWTAPLGWRVTDGELRLVRPHQELLARFAETPVSVVAHSQSADVEAPLVYVGEGVRVQDYERVNVEGKVVLTTGHAREVHRQAVVDRGALGTIHIPSLERRAQNPNLVIYEGIWPTADEKKRIGFAFAVSGKVGTRLHRLVQTERQVIVHATIEAELFQGEQPVLSAVIDGREHRNEEVLLLAHLCHPIPGANDNASGSALLLEIARTITKLIEREQLPSPLRTIRFLWVPEFFGTVAYLHAHPELIHRIISGINCDMVGENAQQCGGVLNLRRTPDSLPNFINDLLEFHLESATREPRLVSPAGTNQPFHFETHGFDWRSDNVMLVDAGVGVPCVMLNHWPDNYYHSNEDTVDKCDATALQRVGYAVAMSTLSQAYAESDDAAFIATEVHARALGRLTQTTQHIIHQAVQVATNKTKGPVLTRILRRGMETIRLVSAREIGALQSIQVLSRRDTDLDAFLAGLIDNLASQRQEEIRKLRSVEDLLSASIGYAPLKRHMLRKDERNAAGVTPVRKFKGPLYFTELQRRVPPEDADWLRTRQEKDQGFVELLLELTNFADGHRSLYQILLALEAEFGELANINTITRFTRILTSLGLIETQKNASHPTQNEAK
jgi:aminopeptidase-like protein